MPRWNKLREDEKRIIRELFEDGQHTVQVISETIGRSYNTVFHYLHSVYDVALISAKKRENYRISKLGSKNPMTGKRKEQHPTYKGVLTCPSARGYQLIVKPDWWTSRKRNRHVFYHHVVVCEHLGLTEIPKGYQVHHCDGDKCNNDFSNLVLITIGAHTKLHWYLKQLEGATTISKESTLKWVEAHGGGVWHR